MRLNHHGPRMRPKAGRFWDSSRNEGSNYKLARTYSETEANNFDAETGHRLFDDGKIRTKPSRASSPMRNGYDSRSSSRTSLINSDAGCFMGLEDEYIPGLNFSDVISNWNRPLLDHSAGNSRDVSYLDLKQLHAKVAPQPIQSRAQMFPKETFDSTPKTDHENDPIKKKFKGSSEMDALSYMHNDLGIVHGDLKLENVLIADINSENLELILCDFGMSRVFNPRLSRTSSGDDFSFASRSKSSFAANRRPYNGPDSVNSKSLFSDDSKLGILQLFRPSGLCSVSLSSSHSDISKSSVHKIMSGDKASHNELDSDLPHSHIGSLPYASPELLSPSPPPLGPSADVWALGVLIYTMTVGRLPFQHPYEPRLRAMITAGKIRKKELRQSALVERVIDDDSDSTSSLIDMTRKAEVKRVQMDWLSHDQTEFEWLSELVECCLERDITKRWDLFAISSSLQSHISTST
ncbi:hypothetical protein OY671_002803 [Metschnikowia pulcherrima]|nr:hypothetical protein OY671_002803 [Metschnikowia pulcherrima]